MQNENLAPPPAAPIMKMVRHEVKRRMLTVADARRLTPNMIRITLTGEELKDFPSMAPDDHIKVFVPDAAGEMVMRDYTPRRFSTGDRELVLDFAVHEAGPATAWALSAQPGDQLEIGGPRGSRIVTGTVAHWLLIGDETALPAIGRRLEEATAADRFTVFVTIPGDADRQSFDTPAQTEVHWISGEAAGMRDDALVEHVRAFDLPDDCFVWIATEGVLARRLRAHFLDERGHSKFRLRASGYWVRGEADTTVKFD